VLGGATCWSLGGVLVRLTDGIDIWQIVFFRALVMLVVIGAWIWSLHGRASFAVMRRAGSPAVIAGVAAGLPGSPLSLRCFYTSVAQAVLMMGVRRSSPPCSAGGSCVKKSRAPPGPAC
jgi:hypothetical protein